LPANTVFHTQQIRGQARSYSESIDIKDRIRGHTHWAQESAPAWVNLDFFYVTFN